VRSDERTILIADDERWLDVLCENTYAISAAAATFREAPDGKNRIALANKKRPELIFLDIVMPGRDWLGGFEQLDYDPR